MIRCRACGIEHETRENADAVHAAMRGVRRWLREQVDLSLRPIPRGKARGRGRKLPR